MPSIAVDAESDVARQLLVNALSRELTLVDNSIERTKKRLEEFEKKYQMSTGEFYKRFQAGKLGDADDFIDWAGEHELLEHAAREKRELTRLLKQCR